MSEPSSFIQASLLGNNSVLDPPDPIPNSEVKRNCADDSVGSPHVKVGHCQALTPKASISSDIGAFFMGRAFLYCGIIGIASNALVYSIQKSRIDLA